VGTPFVPPIDPAYSDSLRKSFGILYRNVNNHNWFGLLSTVKIKWNDFFSFTGGIDLRTYKGQHWREVYDLIGGQYFHPGSGLNNPNHPGPLYFKGDIFQFHNDGLVRWGGVFGEAEYSKKKVSAFVNISTSNSWYRRIDYFKLDTNGGKTNWISRTGATFKTGLNYNFNRHWNAYTNLGYLNRPTRFNNIFDNRNREVKAAKNEIVYAAEGGIGYKSRKFTMDANAYYTLWQNRPLNTLPSFRDLEGNLYSYNINGLAARHVGLEIAAVWKPLAGITMEGVVSMADWIWTSGSRAIVYSDAGDSIGQVDFDARGVHVGDAAQQQLAAIFRWEPRQVKGLYLSAQWVRFSKHYADFEPTALVEGPSGNFKGRESYLMPAYWYLNLSGGYKLPWIKKSQFTIYGNVQNVTGNLYISDAQHRNVNGDPATTFNAKNLEVFVSPGLRFTTGMRVTF
jgi:iron complex outermembrane receptor protein